jgi:hypothetical protein
MHSPFVRILKLFQTCSYLYEYHHQRHCRCVQEPTMCRGNKLRCQYKLGRNCYEADIQEGDKNG